MVPEQVWDWHFCSYRCWFFWFFVLFFVSPCFVLSVASWGSVSVAVSSSSWERRFLYSYERYIYPFRPLKIWFIIRRSWIPLALLLGYLNFIQIDLKIKYEEIFITGDDIIRRWRAAFCMWWYLPVLIFLQGFLSSDCKMVNVLYFNHQKLTNSLEGIFPLSLNLSRA
jgi:hypothetical protein